MTLKQREFVKKYILNKGNGTQAAMEAYNAKNYNTAHAIAVENLQKPTIKREIELALEAKGLTDEYISELLQEATISGIGQKSTNSDALRGIEMMLKLKNAFPSKVHKTAHLRLDYRQELEKMTTKELEARLREQQSLIGELLKDLTD